MLFIFHPCASLVIDSSYPEFGVLLKLDHDFAHKQYLGNGRIGVVGYCSIQRNATFEKQQTNHPHERHRLVSPERNFDGHLKAYVEVFPLVVEIFLRDRIGRIRV